MNRKTHYDAAAIDAAYSRVAWIYDTWSRLTESSALSRVLVFASIANGESVLEVAAGIGRLLEQIVKENPDGRNAGLDSGSMLSRAGKRMARYPGCSLVCGDASELPYRVGTFDVLINSYMLDLLPREDYPVILEEFRRVLKPGGRLVIATMAHGRDWFSRIWDVVARKAPSLLTGCRPVALDSILDSADFRVEETEYVTENTCPSCVIRATPGGTAP